MSTTSHDRAGHWLWKGVTLLLLLHCLGWLAVWPKPRVPPRQDALEQLQGWRQVDVKREKREPGPNDAAIEGILRGK